MCPYINAVSLAWYSRTMICLMSPLAFSTLPLALTIVLCCLFQTLAASFIAFEQFWKMFDVC